MKILWHDMCSRAEVKGAVLMCQEAYFLHCTCTGPKWHRRVRSLAAPHACHRLHKISLPSCLTETTAMLRHLCKYAGLLKVCQAAKVFRVPLIDWISGAHSRGYTDLQSLVKCLDHRGIVLVLNTVCSQVSLMQWPA